jgi:serine protease AprX
VAYTLIAVPAEASTDYGDGELLGDDHEWGESSGNSGGYSMWDVADAIGADKYWSSGYDGSGVDVAIIDSGIMKVDGLDDPGKVTYGPDLSFESQADNLRHLDTYGHGTHLAGIIAGNKSGFRGIAPGAGLVSLKVADANGAVDVTQVIAAIDWVVEHRQDNGLNIRVLNLAYGTDGHQAHETDPIHYAVERAWDAGIVVVVSAGNDGADSALRNPATDPFVITVGASDMRGEDDLDDHRLADFSSCGNWQRHVDIVAPGKSIVSLRVPGSHADVEYASARVGSDKFKGSGTSQAAAVVSGAAALIIDQRPGISPDQLKKLIMEEAEEIDDGSSRCQGEGSIDLGEVKSESTPQRATQNHAKSNGRGSVNAVRGSQRVVDNGVAISGEIDIFGNDFDTDDWVEDAEDDNTWEDGDWNGASWSGASWSGASWSGASWSGASWSGASWSGKSWSGASWSGASWSGASWSGSSWSGGSWSGSSWSGLSWE